MRIIDVEHDAIRRQGDRPSVQYPLVVLPAPKPGGPRWLFFLVLAVSVLLGAALLLQHPSPSTRLEGATAGGPEREAADRTGQPAPELAAVLDILFKDRQRGPTLEEPREEPRRPLAPSAETERKPESADFSDPERTKAAQRRLAALGYFRGEATGAWPPEARQALRDFKAASQLPSDDVWDAATEQALFGPGAVENVNFVGLWAPEPAACSPRNRGLLLPALINQQGAWAGEVSCAFANGRREGSTWTFTASCSSGRRRWAANVKLAVAGDVLTWTSERGTQRYVRCPAG